MPLKVVTAQGKEGEIHSPADFEAALSVRYVSSLEYQDDKTEKVLKKRYEKAQRKGWITPRQKWLGCYFASSLSGTVLLDVTLRWIDDLIGYGVFTNLPLSPNTCIGEYAGVIRRRRFFRRWENLYCFDYTIGEKRSTSYVIDAQDAGNHTRFINHSAQPNLNLVSVDYQGRIHVVLYTAREISAGEQLCYDYGEDYWQKRPSPLPL